jgi:hypothetical protein
VTFSYFQKYENNEEILTESQGLMMEFRAFDHGYLAATAVLTEMATT